MGSVKRVYFYVTVFEVLLLAFNINTLFLIFLGLDNFAAVSQSVSHSTHTAID